MDLNNIIDSITFKLMKLVNKLLSLKTDNDYEEEILALECRAEEEEKEEEEKFFNKKTIFDDLSNIESSLVPIKQFCLEKYEYFKAKYDALEKKAEIFYQPKKQEIVCHLTVELNIDPKEEVLKDIRNLSDEIAEYKKQELNYKAITERLVNLNGGLKKLYKRLIAGEDKKILKSATEAFDRISNDAANMEFAENPMKQENICRLFCESAYTLHKCNVISGIEAPLELYEKEKGVIFSLFQKNVEENLQLIEVFRDKKYYVPLKMFFTNLTMKKVNEDFLNNKDFLEFVKNEKKVYELNFHYSNKKKEEKEKDILEISKIKEYFNTISLKYPANYRLKFFITILNGLDFDLSFFEVYNLIHVFGLKTFSKNHLKNVSDNDDTDLIKVLFEIEELPEHNLNATPSSDYVVIYQNDDLSEIEKVSKKFENLKLEYAIDVNKVLLNKAYFEGCNNILKNLKLV